MSSANRIKCLLSSILIRVFNLFFRPVFKMMIKYMCLVLFITWYQLADGHPANSDVQSLDSMIEKVRIFYNSYFVVKKKNM